MEQIIPKINTEELQEKANEFAKKGAIKTLENFYTGYDSPYCKAIEENLKNRGFDGNFTLPDVVANINESLSKEIDKIANTAVAKTFVPLVTNFLTRADKEIKFSRILEEFISSTDFDHEENDIYDYQVEIKKEDGSFIRLTISDGEDDYDIGLYNDSKYNQDVDENYKWTIYSLPFTYNDQKQKTMKLSVGDASLEIPFTKGVLENRFVSFIAQLVMAETRIFIDCKDFSEEMFPERNHCQC